MNWGRFTETSEFGGEREKMERIRSFHKKLQGKDGAGGATVEAAWLERDLKENQEDKKLRNQIQTDPPLSGSLSSGAPSLPPSVSLSGWEFSLSSQLQVEKGLEWDPRPLLLLRLAPPCALLPLALLPGGWRGLR